MENKISELELKLQALYESHEVLKDKVRKLIKLAISTFLLVVIIIMTVASYLIHFYTN